MNQDPWIFVKIRLVKKNSFFMETIDPVRIRTGFFVIWGMVMAHGFSGLSLIFLQVE